MFFRILWGIDVVIAAIIVFFFLYGLVDGSVSSFNAGLWFVVLVTVAALLWGGHALRRAGREVPAMMVLAVLAVPGLLYGLFILSILILQPRWN